MKEAAKNLLKGLGSQVAATLSWRDMWTLVVKKGGGDAPFVTDKLTTLRCSVYHCVILSVY